VQPGRDADHSPPSGAEVKNRDTPLLSLRAIMVYEGVKPTYKEFLKKRNHFEDGIVPWKIILKRVTKKYDERN
jgi:hypothetical protein